MTSQHPFKRKGSAPGGVSVAARRPIGSIALLPVKKSNWSVVNVTEFLSNDPQSVLKQVSTFQTLYMGCFPWMCVTFHLVCQLICFHLQAECSVLILTFTEFPTEGTVKPLTTVLPPHCRTHEGSAPTTSHNTVRLFAHW